ncbi:hypothetical protein BH20ACT2_BH20ACT2_10020 [soil metagenome]
MARSGAGARSHRGLLLTYVLVLAAGVLSLVVVLPVGSRITAAPQAPRLAQVNPAAADCLGERVTSVQSGVFLDLHLPGRHGLASGEEVGDKVASGRIDRGSGRAHLRGRCIVGSARAGQAFDLQVVVAAADRQADAGPLGGRLRFDGDAAVAFRAVPEEAGSAVTSSSRELEGGDLAGRVFLAVAVVILVARSVGFLMSRVRQPRVMGEIVAGILLGPSLLGLIAPEVSRFLFPPEVTGFLRVLAQFGLIFFMFLIGLELDHKLIRGSGRTALLLSHVSIIVPFMFGAAISLVIFPLLGGGSFTAFALFMGASMAITAFPVLARILTETGLHRTRLGALAITCAAVDDVTAWCLLAVVVAVVQSAGPVDVVVTVSLSLLFVIAMLFVVHPLVGRLAAIHEARGNLTPPLMAGIILALLLAAWTTEAIGIHAIFGAFMFGAVLPRSRRLVSDITARLEDMTVLLLLPIFFAVVGLSTRFGLLDHAELWLVAVMVVVVAVLGKWGGSMLAARIAGEGWRSANALGLLMNTRGLTEIIILTVGRSLGVISPALFTIMVLMALVTTLMATPLLAVLYPRTLIDRDVARVAAVERIGHGRGHVARVMVGVGNPATAGPVVDLVADLRSPDGKAPTVVLAQVVAPPGREEVRANLGRLDAVEVAAAAGLAPLRDRLARRGVSAELVSAVSADRGTELARLAQANAADVVIIGEHQAFVGSNPLGGTPAGLLRDARAEVAVLIGAERTSRGELGDGPAGDAPVALWFRGVLRDLAAVDLAASLARGQGTSLRVVCKAPGEMPDLGIAIDQVVVPEAELGTAIAALANASILVMGLDGGASHAWSRLRAALIAAAPVPVLVVRDQAVGDETAEGGTARRAPSPPVASDTVTVNAP